MYDDLTFGRIYQKASATRNFLAEIVTPRIGRALKIPPSRPNSMNLVGRVVWTKLLEPIRVSVKIFTFNSRHCSHFNLLNHVSCVPFAPFRQSEDRKLMLLCWLGHICSSLFCSGRRIHVHTKRLAGGSSFERGALLCSFRCRTSLPISNSKAARSV